MHNAYLAILGRINMKLNALLVVLGIACLLAWSGVRAAVIGCPPAPIRLLAAQALIITFTEDPIVPEFCDFRVIDFDLANHGNFFFTHPFTESDRFVFNNVLIPGVGNQAHFCFASDPNLSVCTLDPAAVDPTKVPDERQFEGRSTTKEFLFQGNTDKDKGLDIIITSDTETPAGEGAVPPGRCSDSLTGSAPPKTKSNQVLQSDQPQFQCAAVPVPEPGALPLLGFGACCIAICRRLRWRGRSAIIG